ncbi:tRNA 5-methoxyuridine(34)/uridine 5-oxyacetic acid(34) synthase CmoB [Thiomicrospira sp. R3]|uniref:tRNA 5-methoxyuridine(34)/uridine 5-oxyacetic acid(34) synthase CmoB n=1 Tax=Thiomicrospira sp. R3 TaxID=3035472 RepID=UPI00259BBB98|nr:tRNA 5-methoxyuridine(34)/uridine 5-oxyacetic acid(34) synthase CmoB [Thiomicrospira sp. R3]WFE69525.1 tRNA 5-methoxyuridine(34)/uridine 5-oxyacetic acid(34) synthase CmoB [Thiomicrospira sp. R3]
MKHHLDSLWPQLKDTRIAFWREQLAPLIEDALHPEGNGNLPRWLDALERIQQFKPAEQITLNKPAIQTGYPPLNKQQKQQLEDALRGLMPWRKGPYDLQGIYIDTEWRSDWKWERVLPHLAPLKDRIILDVGCGSGYHLWRMTGEGAKLVVGIDPSLLFMAQFLAVRHFIGETPTYFLPLPLETLPESKLDGAFDSVFSMGVLYHRRSPLDHLDELKRQLRKGGELVLETLVIPEEQGQLLIPQDRYAQMRNVWFLPSVNELIHWMQRLGFENVRCVDLDQTSTDEQRSTDWMQWNSLKDFLDPNDPNKTCEGYPAPLRAVILATKPS